MRTAELQGWVDPLGPRSGSTIGRSIPHSPFRIPHSCDKVHKLQLPITMATDSILRPGELKEILLKEIQTADLAEIDVREVGTVLEVKDGIARIYGLTSAMAGERLQFPPSETSQEGAGRGPHLAEGKNRPVLFASYS